MLISELVILLLVGTGVALFFTSGWPFGFGFVVLGVWYFRFKVWCITGELP